MHPEYIATVFSYKRVFHVIHNTQTTQSMHIPVWGLLIVHAYANYRM